jgi:3-deoxy-D-manno-octulosonate 8-phosphate phosphatase (KDO 8-P phosphatase)
MIKLIVVDVDGTLTDGKIYYDEHGNQMRGFNVHDGLMMVAWRKLGGKIAIITGKVSSQVERRGKELGVDFIRQGVRNKAVVLEDIVDSMEISYKEVAVIGDDFNDLPLFRLAGRTFAPANANHHILHHAHYRLKREGGNGAVAEMIEILIKEQRKWGDFLNLWK